MKRRPRRPRGTICPAGPHKLEGSATARGYLFSGNARWCPVHDRWECRRHMNEHVQKETEIA